MHVILIKNGYETSDATLNALRHGSISVEVSNVSSGVAIASDSDAGAKSNAASNPFAVIHEVAESDDSPALQTLISEVVAAYPKAALVACRRTDDSTNDAMNKSLKFNEHALKLLGFHAVADEPSQLPTLLREIEKHSLARNAASTDSTSKNPVSDSFAQTMHTANASVLLSANLPPRQLRTAFELVAELHFVNDQKSAAQTAFAGLSALVRADLWTLYLYNETANDGATLEPLASHGVNQREYDSSENDWRRALRGDDILLPETHSKAALRSVKLAETVRASEHGRRILAIPLIVALTAQQTRGDKVLGVLEITREVKATHETTKLNGNGSLTKTNAKAFSKSEVNLLNALAAPVAAALANAARIAEAERLSLTDDLTKLHNARFLRQFLVNEIKRARRYGSSVAALFLDLDDFKQINDRHGHLVGSHVLREMAQVILIGVRDTDSVARYGGDEFVVILPETNVELATRVAERVRERIAKTVFHGGRNLRLHLTASFGVAAFPEHVQSPQQLLACADTAMYEAKAARKNCVRAADSFSSGKD